MVKHLSLKEKKGGIKVSVIKGDFLGFTFNGIHSSELGVFRVSDGNRYSENLLPTIQDKIIQRPGADGTFYYGSYYTQKPFNLPIAFDELTEEQLRRLKTLFSDKKPHDLIFDEAPYKVYKVKATGTPNLKYVCFDKPKKRTYDELNLNESEYVGPLYGMGPRSNEPRVYKGEGQLNFVAYEPFARSRYKYLDEYTFKNIPEWGPMDENVASSVYHNYYGWAESSRMVTSKTKKKFQSKSYQIDQVTPNGVMYYNPGDKEAPFKLDFYFTSHFPGCTIGQSLFGLSDFDLYEGDSGIRINTHLHLVEGIDDTGAATGTLYNKYILAGDFFKFNPTEDLTWLPFYWSNNEPDNFKGNIYYYYLYV